MEWRKLLPRPRWLPREAIMRPQRVVVVCFAVVMALTFVVALHELYPLRERTLDDRQHSLALHALGVEAVLSVERQHLTFLRDYAEHLFALYTLPGADADDPAIEAAYAARNAPVWEMTLPLDDAPVVGVGAAQLAGLPGFSRRDADLRADLQVARALSHLLGRIAQDERVGGNVMFISGNGLYVVYRATRDATARQLLERFSAMSYYRGLLPERDPDKAVRWAPIYTRFQGTQQMTTVSVPIYATGRFRGVVAIDVAQTRLEALLDAGNAPDDAVYLMGRNGELVAATQGNVVQGKRCPDGVPGPWRDVTPARLFEADAGVLRRGGEWLVYQRLGNGQRMLLDPLPPRR